jgi:DNA polymerase elongation subunit (family B)
MLPLKYMMVLFQHILLSKGIVPPNRPMGAKKLNYAGGYLFCPKAGLYKYMFDEDLTSLYPSIIMSLNIGQETFMGRIVPEDLPENLQDFGPYSGKPDRNNYFGLSDLKNMDPERELVIKNHRDKAATVTVEKLIELIEKNKWTVSANGCFFRTDKESVLSTILNKWFDERVLYKNRMKKAYKAGDTEGGEKNHLLQYTMKILLNSLIWSNSITFI